MRKLLSAAIMCLSVHSALAVPPPFPQPKPGDERILLPFATLHLPGAFGTVWSSRITVHNSGMEAVTLLPSFASTVLSPGQTKEPGIYESSIESVPGLVAYVPPNSNLSFSAVVFQENPAYDTEAVMFPAVRESQLHHSAVQLLDIPTDLQHRVEVRIFDLDFREDALYRIRVYKPSTEGMDVLVDEKMLTIHRDDVNQPDLYNPGRASYRPSISTEEAPSLRIEVTPLGSDSHFWAAASVTDNRTQHVRVIVP